MSSLSRVLNVTSSILSVILQPIFFLILNMMGWKVPSKEELRLEKGKYNVWVFSHTTKMDFFFSALYKLAQPEYGRYSYVLLMPGLYNKFTTPILNWLSFLRATHSKDTGAGLVNRVVDIAKSSSEIHVAMSPEGTLTANPWKAGYYWMAKGIQVELPDEQIYIRVTGFDYYKKELIFHGNVPVPKFDKTRYDSMSTHEKSEFFREERMKIEKELQEHMADIVPLYPEKSFVKPNWNAMKETQLICEEISDEVEDKVEVEEVKDEVSKKSEVKKKGETPNKKEIRGAIIEDGCIIDEGDIIEDEEVKDIIEEITNKKKRIKGETPNKKEIRGAIIEDGAIIDEGDIIEDENKDLTSSEITNNIITDFETEMYNTTVKDKDVKVEEIKESEKDVSISKRKKFIAIQQTTYQTWVPNIVNRQKLFNSLLMFFFTLYFYYGTCSDTNRYNYYINNIIYYCNIFLIISYCIMDNIYYYTDLSRYNKQFLNGKNFNFDNYEIQTKITTQISYWNNFHGDFLAVEKLVVNVGFFLIIIQQIIYGINTYSYITYRFIHQFILYIFVNRTVGDKNMYIMILTLYTISNIMDWTES